MTIRKMTRMMRCTKGSKKPGFSGLYYLNARYYDPDIGRFISQDTYRGELDDPNQWHLYVYCANDPINYIDPSGHYMAVLRLGSGVYRLSKAKKVMPVGSTVQYKGTLLVVTSIIGYTTYRGLTYSKVKAEKKPSKKTKKERSTDFPNWVRQYKPKSGENGKSFAKRVCDDKFGKGNYKTGPKSAYNQIKKARDRGAIK